MTESDKAKLAYFAGLYKDHGRAHGQWAEPCWVSSPGGDFICRESDWSPDTDPAHGDLVMRALVEKMSWSWVVSFLILRLTLKAPDAFWPAVCQAALEIVEKTRN